MYQLHYWCFLKRISRQAIDAHCTPAVDERLVHEARLDHVGGRGGGGGHDGRADAARSVRPPVVLEAQRERADCDRRVRQQPVLHEVVCGQVCNRSGLAEWNRVFEL